MDYQEKRPNNMAAASMVMGILAMVTCCCYYTVFLFGGLGILFALLSHTEEKLRGQAKAGLILSVLSIIMMVLVWAGLFFFLLNSAEGSAIRNMPVIPEIPEGTTPFDNVLTVFWQMPIRTGGGV